MVKLHYVSYTHHSVSLTRAKTRCFRSRIVGALQSWHDKDSTQLSVMMAHRVVTRKA